MSYFRSLLLVIGVVACMTSCRTPKDITYFQGQENGQSVDVVAPNFITAQPDDRLTISVHSRDAQLAEIFNLPIQSRQQGQATGRGSNAQRSSSSGNQVSVYTVNNYGDIEFPELGTIHIQGLTRQEIAQLIKDELINRKLLKDPTVTVDFADHSITVVGAVASSRTYPFRPRQTQRDRSHRSCRRSSDKWQAAECEGLPNGRRKAESIYD